MEFHSLGVYIFRCIVYLLLAQKRESTWFHLSFTNELSRHLKAMISKIKPHIRQTQEVDIIDTTFTDGQMYV